VIDVLWPVLLRCNLALSLLIILILGVRQALRKAHFNQWAYSLWLILPLSLFMPQFEIQWLQAESAAFSPAVTRSLNMVIYASGKDQGVTLMSIWLIGCCVVLLRLSVRHLSFIRWLNPTTIDHTAHFHSVTLMHSQRLNTPICVGVFRPKIVIPINFIKNTNAEQLYWILHHEATHCRRHDPLYLLLAELLKAVFWFNPLVYWAKKHFVIDQEISCDAKVLANANPKQRKSYAETLLFTTKNTISPGILCHASTHIQERIMSITSSKSGSTGARLSLYSLMILVASFGTGMIYAESGELHTPAPDLSPPTAPPVAPPVAPPAPPKAALAPLSEIVPIESKFTKPAKPAKPPQPAPVILHRAAPLYPRNAVKQKVEGRVTVHGIIQPDGQVDSVRVVNSFPEGTFDEYAVNAFKQWRFTQTDTPRQVTQIFEFKLD